jgi:mitochondrial import inner membrane translocase subunit TIM13
MSRFGFGGGKGEDSNKKPSTSAYDTGLSSGFGDDHGTEFASPSSSFGAASSAGAGSLEQELVMEQQKALVQAIMFKLTETAFEQCISKPSSSLSSSEQNCITAVVTKYLDTSELVVARMSK